MCAFMNLNDIVSAEKVSVVYRFFSFRSIFTQKKNFSFFTRCWAAFRCDLAKRCTISKFRIIIFWFLIIIIDLLAIQRNSNSKKKGNEEIM